MESGLIIKRALDINVIKQVWLVDRLNDHKELLKREADFSTSLISYKLKNNSFSAEEFLIECQILNIDVESIKETCFGEVWSVSGEKLKY